MKKINRHITIGIIALILLGTVGGVIIKIWNLENDLKLSIRKLNEKDIKNSNYMDSFGKILSTNIFHYSLKDSLKVGVKINDYGCPFCNVKILNRLKRSFDKKTLIIILNTNSQKLKDTLNLDGYHVLIDTLQKYNFKSIEPVVFLSHRNYFFYPYSPEMVLAPELFDLYIDKIGSLVNNNYKDN